MLEPSHSRDVTPNKLDSMDFMNQVQEHSTFTWFRETFKFRKSPYKFFFSLLHYYYHFCLYAFYRATHTVERLLQYMQYKESIQIQLLLRWVILMHGYTTIAMQCRTVDSWRHSGVNPVSREDVDLLKRFPTKNTRISLVNQWIECTFVRG
jgi:hypothetical protein